MAVIFICFAPCCLRAGKHLNLNINSPMGWAAAHPIIFSVLHSPVLILRNLEQSKFQSSIDSGPVDDDGRDLANADWR